MAKSQGEKRRKATSKERQTFGEVRELPGAAARLNLCGVEVLDDLFEAAVLLDELEGRLGADARDLVAVVATTHDAKVHKLIRGEAQALDELVVGNLQGV